MRRHRALASLVLFSSLLLGAVAHGQPAGSLGEDFIYRVRAGDTLINIANTYTRNSANWNPLQSLNKIVAPEQLPIGLELHIPLSMIPVRPAEARVVHISGQASAAGKTLAPGASLPEGSTVVTAPNGFVTLELADGSKLTLPRTARWNSRACGNSRHRPDRLGGARAARQRGVLGPRRARAWVVSKSARRSPSRACVARASACKAAAAACIAKSWKAACACSRTPRRHAGQARGRGPRLRAAVGADGTVAGLRQLLPAPQLAAPTRAAVNGPARSSRCPAPRAIWCAYRATPMARSPCLPRFSPATTSVFAPPARHLCLGARGRRPGPARTGCRRHLRRHEPVVHRVRPGRGHRHGRLRDAD